MDVRVHKRKALLSTEGLNRARSHQSSSVTSDKIFVEVEVRVKDSSKRTSQSTDPTYGKWGKVFNRDTYVSEVLDCAIETANQTWEKEHSISLTRNDAEFRFANNKIFMAGTQNSTLSDVHATYMTGELGSYYAPSEARRKSAKGDTLFLELYIDKVAFIKRTSAMYGSQVNMSLKRTNDTDLTSIFGTSTSELPTKRARTTTRTDYSALSSRVVPLASQVRTASSGEAYEKIRFIQAEAAYVADTSGIEIIWPDVSSAAIQDAYISRTSFASGKTKKVFKLMIGNKLYVAKRFFDELTGKAIANNENDILLDQELTRLKQVAWFLNQFMAHAKKCDVDINRDIQVSDGFLIREKEESRGEDNLDGTESDSVVWLVEPRRTTALEKFSGTLRHPQQENKKGKTITAFVHFVYEISKNTLVLADIQGSPMCINDRSTTVLFDIMTHTPDGSSGAGDFGAKGIASFLEQHKCDFICEGLGLPILGHIDGDSDN